MRLSKRAAVLAALTALQILAVAGAIPLDALFSEKAQTLRMKVRFYDPMDALRGRYIDLSFEGAGQPLAGLPGMTKKIEKAIVSEYRRKAFCRFSPAGPGEFSKLTGIALDKGGAGDYFIEGCYLHAENPADGNAEVWAELPVDRYYMQEDLAPLAEQELRNPERTGVLLLRVAPSGRFVVQGLELDGVPIEKATTAKKRNSVQEP